MASNCSGKRTEKHTETKMWPVQVVLFFGSPLRNPVPCEKDVFSIALGLPSCLPCCLFSLQFQFNLNEMYCPDSPEKPISLYMAAEFRPGIVSNRGT